MIWGIWGCVTPDVELWQGDIAVDVWSFSVTGVRSEGWKECPYHHRGHQHACQRGIGCCVRSPGSSACLAAVWGHWGQARVIWGHIWRHLKSMQRTMVTGFGIILVVNPYSQKLNCFNLFNYFLPVIQVTVHDEKNYYIFFYFVSYEVKELLTYLSNTTQYAWFDKFMFEDNRNTSILSWSVCMSTISIASIWLYTYLWCYFNYNSFKEQ